MADDPRRTRPTGPVTRTSRAPLGRPRRVAGSATPVEAPVEKPVETPVETPVESSGEAPTAAPVEAPVEDVAPAAVAAPSFPSGPSRSTPVTTIALSVLVVVLLVVGVLEVVYLNRGHHTDTTTSTSRPVVVSDVTVGSVLDQASHAVQVLLSASYQKFDQQVDQATALMTPTFASRYRATKSDIRAKFLAQKATVTVSISNDGVVRADPSQVQALFFLTQETDKPSGTSQTQYRVVVTMLHTSSGWKVSDLQAI